MSARLPIVARRRARVRRRRIERRAQVSRALARFAAGYTTPPGWVR